MFIPLKFFLLVGVIACLGLVVWFALMHYQIGPYRPVQKPVPMNLPSSTMSESERVDFVEGDFSIVRKMRALPPTILSNYMEVGRNRLTIVDPGQKFRVGDVVYDASLARKRLIFAGIQSEKFFLHYEQGGRGHSFVLDFLRVDAVNGTKLVWVGHCDRPAADLIDLRNKIHGGGCH